MSATPWVLATALIPTKSTSLTSYLTTSASVCFHKIIEVINACLKGMLHM